MPRRKPPAAPPVIRRATPPTYRFAQYHNQATSGTLHKHLTAMWEAVRRESEGRVATVVHAENNNTGGGDPAVLRKLIDGEVQFFTLMGGLIGALVPVAEAQQLPFAFMSARQAHRAIDGALGRYMAKEMAQKGLYLFPVAGFDNGMRHVATVSRPVARPEDLGGMKVRVPPSQVFLDTFRAFGAEPIASTSDQVYEALKSGKVEAQENPLAILEGFKLYELVRYVSLTGHMWSGFNLIAHLPTWTALPPDIRRIIERNAASHVRRQRQEQGALNAALRARFAERGLIFNEVEQGPFRARLTAVYATWKERFGRKCWDLLEASVGKLG